MSKEEFIKWFEDYKDGLTTWKVDIDNENMTDYVVGCFRDNKSGTWKVYINMERGRHRIRLETNNENQAFDKLKSLVTYVLENGRGYY